MQATTPLDPWLPARQRMVQMQIRDRGVCDESVLEAMATVPREKFLPESARDSAFDDRAVPIGLDQTISQPYIVAYMTQQLNVAKDHRVLEIGTGSGYQTAILARLCGHVYTIERIASLQDSARTVLGALGFQNVSYLVADGTLGWPEEAPFDRILITAAAPQIPMRLADQLTPAGQMILPVGAGPDHTIVRVFREGSRIVEIPLLACRFVKLIGEDAWPG